MCTEIGERLREILARDQTVAPASIENRLNRLRELDDDDLFSIVPPTAHSSTCRTHGNRERSGTSLGAMCSCHG
jgi:hypothetical protein